MASAAKAPVIEHTERRRSERFPIRVTLMVCGESMGNRPFKEETVTLSVNSHGALVALSTNVALGQRLLLINRQTWDEVEARVSRLAALDGQGTQVAVEFTPLAPDFWPIGAPPKRVCHTKTESNESTKAVLGRKQEEAASHCQESTDASPK